MKLKEERNPNSISSSAKLAALLQSLGSLDIVGQHERELLALRPAGPALGRTGGRFVDRPDVSAGLALPTAKEPADGHAHAPRDKGLQDVIDAAAEHGQKSENGGKREGKSGKAGEENRESGGGNRESGSGKAVAEDWKNWKAEKRENRSGAEVRVLLCASCAFCGKFSE